MKDKFETIKNIVLNCSGMKSKLPGGGYISINTAIGDLDSWELCYNPDNKPGGSVAHLIFHNLDEAVSMFIELRDESESCENV